MHDMHVSVLYSVEHLTTAEHINLLSKLMPISSLECGESLQMRTTSCEAVILVVFPTDPWGTCLGVTIIIMSTTMAIPSHKGFDR